MKMKEHISKFNSDFSFRTVVGTVFSLFVNLAFIVSNCYLGIRFADDFAVGIAIYYLLLFAVMLTAVLVEVGVSKKEPDTKNCVRVKFYKVAIVLVFIIDLCLIAPIIMMATNPKDVAFGLIPAIAMATFCVYKIVMAVINYRRSKRSQNPTTILLKQVNVIGTVVSILTLQHTLIMVNGGMNSSMRTLSLMTSIAFLIFIITFSIVSYIKNRPLFIVKKTIGKDE